MLGFEDLSRVLAVGRELEAALSGVDEPDAELLKRTAAAIVAQVDGGSCRSPGSLACWLLDSQHDSAHEPVIGALSLGAVRRVFALCRPDRAGTAPSSAPSSLFLPAPLLQQVLSYEALSRARTTLKDFCAFYLPLHGLSVTAFFRFLPILVFVEAAIYQLDEDNEQLASDSLHASRSGLGADPSGGLSRPPSARVSTALHSVLRTQGLLSQRVLARLREGERYWELERKLSAAMAAGMAVSETEVREASSLKSFDYRVLNEVLLLLIARARADRAERRGPPVAELRGPPVASPAPVGAAPVGAADAAGETAEGTNRKRLAVSERTLVAGGDPEGQIGDCSRAPAALPDHFGALGQFLRVDEQLTDICDDLRDYETDVLRNSFNVLRGLAHVHGDEATCHLARLIGELECEHRTLLSKLPKGCADCYRDCRRRAMKKEGTERWIFPAVVFFSSATEATFRDADAAKSSPSSSETDDSSEWSDVEIGMGDM
mgnify:CR=1 FL=1